MQADCQEPGSAPEPYARQSSMRYLLLIQDMDSAFSPDQSVLSFCATAIAYRAAVPQTTRQLRPVIFPSRPDTNRRLGHQRRRRKRLGIGMRADENEWPGLGEIHMMTRRRCG